MPSSIHYADIKNPDCSKQDTPLEISSKPLASNEELKIAYTYSITFQKNNTIKWSSRWDYILESMPQTNIQWYIII